MQLLKKLILKSTALPVLLHWTGVLKSAVTALRESFLCPQGKERLRTGFGQGGTKLQRFKNRL
jgi:hypothetical protein